MKNNDTSIPSPYNFEQPLIQNIQTYYQQVLDYVTRNPGKEPAMAFFFNPSHFPHFLNYVLSEQPETFDDEIVPLFQVNSYLEEVSITPDDLRYCTPNPNFPTEELVNQILLQLERLMENPQEIPVEWTINESKASQVSTMLESFGYQLVLNEEKQFQLYTNEEALNQLINNQQQERYGK